MTTRELFLRLPDLDWSQRMLGSSDAGWAKKIIVAHRCFHSLWNFWAAVIGWQLVLGNFLAEFGALGYSTFENN
jgi:hypothetical protein